MTVFHTAKVCLNLRPSEWREATQKDVGDDACSPDIHLQTVTVGKAERRENGHRKG